MFKVAFSTVACPSWPLERVARAAAEWEYSGVELRTFGEGSTRFVCDPGLTDAHKVSRLFRSAGVEIAGLGTGVSFDEAIWPPVLGHLLPGREASVREGRHMVDLAERTGARFVRTFGFQVPRKPFESRRSTFRRVCDRLGRVCDRARNRDVVVLIENGGSFPAADDLAQIIARVASPLLMASYDLFPAHSVGEDVLEGVELLGDKLAVARLRDRGVSAGQSRPLPLGLGELPCAEFIGALAKGGYDNWVTYEWERAWVEGLAPAEDVLPSAVRTIYAWAAGSARPAGAFSAA